MTDDRHPAVLDDSDEIRARFRRVIAAEPAFRADPSDALDAAVGAGSRRRARARASRALALAACVVLLVGVAAGLYLMRPTPTPVGGPLGIGTRLQIRPVLEEGVAAHGKCASKPVQAQPSEPVTACSLDGTLVLQLGPAAVVGDQVTSLTARPWQPGGAEIVVGLDPDGSAAFSSLTAGLAQQQAPRNQLAFYVDGRVPSSPFVSERLAVTTVEITGYTSVAQAQDSIAGMTRVQRGS
jgi:hypothetical protein